MPPTAAELLSDSGPVAAALRSLNANFETRPQQLAMAEAVARTMDRGERLIVEAGTGVGKSFAYLVPAILRAITTREKVVIATATIALQEQLINKDIPLLVKALGLGESDAGMSDVRYGMWDVGGGTVGAGHPTSDISHPTSPIPSSLRHCITSPLVPVLAKGRGNYVSIRRLHLASARQQSLLHDQAQVRSLHVIEDWAYTTLDGSLATLPAGGVERHDVWDHVRSDADNCMGRKCPHFKDCFYQKARRELEKANLIVCNHALFFADLALRLRNTPQSASGGGGGGGGVLPAYDHVVLDEAHNVEDAACEHFGLSLSRSRVNRLLRTLFSPRRRKGYLLERGLALADTTAVDRALSLVQHAEEAGREFFDGLYAYWRRNRSASGRLRRPGMEIGLDNPLSPVMSELAVCLRRIRDQCEGDGRAEQDRFELAGFARRAAEIADCAEAMLEQTLGRPGDYAYWVDVEGGEGAEAGDAEGGGYGGGGRFTRVTLACAPVDVSKILRAALFTRPSARPEVEFVPAEDEAWESDEAEGRPMSDVGWEMSDPGSIPSHVPHPTSDIPPPTPETIDPTPKSVVLTSATLATRTVREGEHAERAETAFAHLIASIGVDGARTLQLGSPFDYARQARMIVDLSVPDPKKSGGVTKPRSDGAEGRPMSDVGCRMSDPGHTPSHIPHPTSDIPPSLRHSVTSSYTSILASRIHHHVHSTRGGAFVLFTSFASMHAVADLLKPRFDLEGLVLLVQGRDGPRSLMLQRFLQASNGAEGRPMSDVGCGMSDLGGVPSHIPHPTSDIPPPSPILFGAASFWQGVDVRGERLRNVIITRLPFEPPDRPLTQARLERIEEQGGSPFMQDSLPRAIIRFKQGFGRLIRSGTDTGQVVVLDPRIRTARYGKMFLDALPKGLPIEVVRG